jgi:hypothetical protein
MNTQTEETNHIRDYLLINGWKRGPNVFTKAICYYKRFPSKKRCYANSGKAGIQVQLAVFETANCFDGINQSTLELSIVSQLKDETALKIINYCLPKNLNKVIKLIPRLIRIWEAQ